jgi:hypothetical protein
MNEWTGPTRGGAADPKIIERLDSRLRNCLSGTSLTLPEIEQIAREIIQAVQYAFVGRDNRLRSNRPGRPVRAAQTLLSVEVGAILKINGLRGNWMALGDESEDGEIGVVANVESFAQTALSEAIGRHQQICDQAAIDENGGNDTAVNHAKPVAARPARLSEAHNTLGEIIRE